MLGQDPKEIPAIKAPYSERMLEDLRANRKKAYHLAKADGYMRITEKYKVVWK